MDHGDAVGRQSRRQLISHPHHVAGAVRRAEGAGGHILPARRHGVCLAGVAVDNEHLRPLPGTGHELAVPQHRRVQGAAGLVLDVHPVDDAVAVGGAGGHRLGRDAVVCPRLGILFLRWSGCGGLRRRQLVRVLRLGSRIPDSQGPARQQHRRLAQGQHRGGGQTVQPQNVPQLPAQQSPGYIGAAGHGLPQCGGGVGPAACQHRAQCRRGQQQRQPPPQDHLFQSVHLFETSLCGRGWGYVSITGGISTICSPRRMAYSIVRRVPPGCPS